MASFNRSKLNSAISKFNSAVRQHNSNVRRARDEYNRAVRRYNAHVRELQRQLSSLRTTTTVRTSIVIQRELHVASAHQERGFLVRENEWDALGYGEQQQLRSWTEQRDMEFIVVDSLGNELYRP